MSKKDIIIIISTLCVCGLLIWLGIALSPKPFQPDFEYQLKFDATDSGVYFNYYVETDTLGKPSRKFGPVKEYRYEDNIDTARIMDSLKLWYKEIVLQLPDNGNSSN